MLGRWRLRARSRPRLPAAALLLAVVTSTFAPGVSDAAATDGVARLRTAFAPASPSSSGVVNVSSELAVERAGTKPAATQPAAAIERTSAAEGDGPHRRTVAERDVRWRLLDDAAVNDDDDDDGGRARTDPAPSAPMRPQFIVATDGRDGSLPPRPSFVLSTAHSSPASSPSRRTSPWGDRRRRRRRRSRG